MSAEQQVELLRRTATAQNWAISQVFVDRPTAVKKGRDRRPGESALADAIRRGAIEKVLFWSLDRVGASISDLVSLLAACQTASVSVWIEEQGLDTETSNGLSLLDVAAMFAHHLRQSRRDRILRGQAAARSLSIRFGRPPIAGAKRTKVQQALMAGKGVRQVARLMGISPASVIRIRNSVGFAQPRV